MKDSKASEAATNRVSFQSNTPAPSTTRTIWALSTTKRNAIGIDQKRMLRMPNESSEKKSSPRFLTALSERFGVAAGVDELGVTDELAR